MTVRPVADLSADFVRIPAIRKIQKTSCEYISDRAPVYIDEPRKHVFPVEIHHPGILTRDLFHGFEIAYGGDQTVLACHGVRPWKIRVMSIDMSILKNNISCLCFFKKTKCHNASPCICNYNYSIINQAVMIY